LITILALAERVTTTISETADSDIELDELEDQLNALKAIVIKKQELVNGIYQRSTLSWMSCSCGLLCCKYCLIRIWPCEV